MEFTAKSIRYPSGCMGTMVSGRMLKDRCDVHSDKSLGWLRGLISQDPAKQPGFKDLLQSSVPPGCVCSYESPSSPNNFNGFQHPDGTHDPLNLPSCWSMLFAAENVPRFVELVQMFIQVAVLSPEAGWVQAGDGSHLLVRTAAPPGRDPWTEGMTLLLAPRGQYTAEEAAHFARLHDMNKSWLKFDGELAYILPVEKTLSV